MEKMLKKAGISQREFNRLNREGARVTDRMLDPIERYQKEIADLNRLLGVGSIEQETFNRAVKTLDTDFRRAESSTSGLERRLGGAAKATLALGAGLLTLGTVNAIGDAFARNAAELDAFAKSADKLGLVPERLRELQIAAQLSSGVEPQILDTAIQKLETRISQAAIGTGEAAASLKELGLSAEELNKVSGDQQFLELADALSKVTNQNDQIRLTEKLLEDGGVALVNTLRLGSDEILKQTEFLRANGLELSRTDLAGVEKLNDSWAKLNIVFESISDKLIADLAPAAAVLIDEFADAVLVGFKMAQIVGVFDDVAGSIKTAALAVNNFSGGLAATSILVGQLTGNEILEKSGVDAFAKAFNQRNELLRGFEFNFDRGVNLDGVAAAASELEKLNDQYQRLLETPADKFNKQISDLNNLLAGEKIDQQQFDTLFERFEIDRDAAIKRLSIDPVVEKLKQEGQRLAESLKSPFELVNDELLKAQELFDGGFIDGDTFGRAIDEQLEKLKRFDQEKESRLADQVNIRNSVERGSAEAFQIIFGRQTADPNTRLLEQQKEINAEQLKELRELAADLRRQAAEAAAQQPDQPAIVNNEINW
jgi:hypothetical protein